MIGSFFEKLFLLLQANLQKSLRSDVFHIKSAIALATKNGQASYQHIVLFTDKISYLSFSFFSNIFYLDSLVNNNFASFFPSTNQFIKKKGNNTLDNSVVKGRVHM